MLARAGLRQGVVPSPFLLQRRHASKGKQSSFTKKVVQRDERGNIIKPQREKSLGAFKPMSPTSLTAKIFDSENRTVLNLPKFSTTQNMVSKATEFPLIQNDPARIYGLPKKMLLEFRILSKPCSVVRDVTVQGAKMLDVAKDSSSLDTRVVLTGRAGCGKSFLLLQLVEHCAANNWIVIYIPRAKKLVDSSTPHEYDLRTQTYLQPAFSLQTLTRLLAANITHLTALTTTSKHAFEKREVPSGTSLADLVNVAVKDPPLAPVVLETVMAELSVQTRNPVLFAVDDFQALYCRTAYRDPHFVPIRPFHLSLPRMILEYASGKKSFARGAFLGALTSSETIYKTPIELKLKLGLPHEHFLTPHDKTHRTLNEYLQGLKSLPVPPQLTLAEAASLFEVWKEDRALSTSLPDETFLAKYTESSGNARDFVWKGLLSTLDTSVPVAA